MRRTWFRWIPLLFLTVGMTASTFAQQAIEIEHYLNPGHGSAVQQATEEIAALFNILQDEIVVRVNVASGGDFEELIMVRTAGGVPPDVLTSNSWGELVGLLRDLNPYVDRDGIRENFVPAALEHGTFNGQLLQLPHVIQPLSTYYDEQLFDEAGVENPFELSRQGRWTWPMIREVAVKIARDSDGDGVLDVWGVNLSAMAMGRTSLFIYQGGGSYFDRHSLPTESRFLSSENERTLEFLHDLVHVARVIPVEGITSWSGYGRFTTQGGVGVIFEGPWIMGQLRQGGRTTWDVAPVPDGPANSLTTAHTDGFQILNAASHPDASWKWIRFLTTDERAVRIFTEATGRPSAYIPHLPVYTQTAVKDGRPVNIQVVVEALLQGGPPTSPMSPYTAELSSAFSREITAYLSGRKGLVPMMETLHHEWNTILNR